MQDLFDDTSYPYAPLVVLTFSAGSFGGYVEMLCSVGFVKVEKLPLLCGRLERFRFSILQSKVFAALRMKRLTGVLLWHNSVALIRDSRNTACVFFRALHLIRKITIVTLRRRRTNQYRHQKQSYTNQQNMSSPSL